MADICPEHGVSDQNVHNQKKKYKGLLFLIYIVRPHDSNYVGIVKQKGSYTCY